MRTTAPGHVGALENHLKTAEFQEDLILKIIVKAFIYNLCIYIIYICEIQVFSDYFYLFL